MQVTADSLFHFTSSLSQLKGILTDKFKVTYCHEKYILDYETHDSYYPMICFCDIPLSLAKRHINSYGQYGMGLTKEWAINNQLNPVVYIEKISHLANGIQNGLDRSVDLINSLGDSVKKVKTDVAKETRMVVKLLDDYLKDWITNKDKANKELRSSHKYIAVQKEILEQVKMLVDRFSTVSGNYFHIFSYIKNYQGVLETNDKAIPHYRFYYRP